MGKLVLSLFPGIGLLDQAFELEGFCVVRGPDTLWGGDVRRFHPPAHRFDGVIGGPPCQSFSRLARLVRHNGDEPTFGNLIPEFERIVSRTRPTWFLMENVPDAPLPAVDGYGLHSFVLNNRQLGEQQSRDRRWSFGVKGVGRRVVLMVDTVPLGVSQFQPVVTATEMSKGMPTGTRKKYGGKEGYVSRSMSHICELQGLPSDFDLPPFTKSAKCKAIGNGVPLPMGRAIARAVKDATKVPCCSECGHVFSPGESQEFCERCGEGPMCSICEQQNHPFDCRENDDDE